MAWGKAANLELGLVGVMDHEQFISVKIRRILVFENNSVFLPRVT